MSKAGAFFDKAKTVMIIQGMGTCHEKDQTFF
jgi:hypothetical protein